MTTATPTTPRNGFTAAEKEELRQHMARMRARDRAAEPVRDAAVVVADLQKSLGFYSRMREGGYAQRGVIRDRVKASGGRPSFDSRSWLAIAEADIRTAESSIRQIKAELQTWLEMADPQRKAREERRERDRKLDQAERKLRGLGLD